MRESSGREPDAPRPPADDLRKIDGIGSVAALRLAEAGITTYQELAALTAERAADITGIAVGRIVNKDWIGQARQLAGNLPEDPQGRQPYTTFHVELLIDPDGAVRRTKIRHYQADTEESWPGWDEEQFMAFFRARLALDTSSGPVPTPRPPPAPPTAPLPIHFEGPRPAEEGTRRSFRLDDQPTAVRMTLRVDRSGAIDADALEFVAEITARAVGGSNRHHLGSINGTTAFDQPSRLELTGPPLPPGLYSLAADVTVYRHGYQRGDEPLLRYRGRGELLHVAHSAMGRTDPRPGGQPRASRGR
jgi:hypothetical protein